MPFKKGESGNPKGRPRRGNTMTDALKKVLREVDPEIGKTNRELVAEALVDVAKSGNVAAANLIYERLDGKVEQAQEVTGAGGAPIKHEHSIDPGALAEAAQILTTLGQNGHANGQPEATS